MKLSRKQGCLLALVGLPLVLWVIYRLIYPSYAWTQETVIVVGTPSGEVRGSGSVKVKWRDGINLFPDAPHFTYSVEGEAAVVDLGNDKYLFALINGAERLGLKMFGENPLPQATNALVKSAKMTASRIGDAPSAIPVEYYPLLVTFDDINDPASVKRVNPDDLDAAFGCPPSVAGQGSATSGTASPRTGGGAEAPAKDKPCYTLKSITLEITGEPVTEGKVEEVLGWLGSVWPNRLDGDRFGNADAANRFANSLSANSFSTEVSK